MKKYTLKRILTSLFTLLAILLVLFILMQMMPGSPFNDEKLNQDQRMALYAKYGLDQPVAVQFVNYVKNMMKGDFGVDACSGKYSGTVFWNRQPSAIHRPAGISSQYRPDGKVEEGLSAVNPEASG